MTDEQQLRALLSLDREHLMRMADLVDWLIEGWDSGYQPLTPEEIEEIVEFALAGEPGEAA